MVGEPGRRFAGEGWEGFSPAAQPSASPRSLLIDDNDANVARFREAGGQAILVPRPWNSSWDVPFTPVELVERELDAWLGKV